MQDSFTRCFKSNSPEPWNWNIYLFPLWCLGVVIRYGILFPLRYLSVKISLILFIDLAIFVIQLIRLINSQILNFALTLCSTLVLFCSSLFIVNINWDFLEPNKTSRAQLLATRGFSEAWC